MSTMEEAIKELCGMVDELQHTRAASVAQPTATSSVTQWEPRYVFIRGFAPYGCASSDKLTRTQDNENAQQFLDMVPAHLKEFVKLDDPYPLSFQLAFRVTGGRSRCLVIRDLFTNGIDQHTITIKGKPVKASVEISPDKRVSFKELYGAVERINSKVDSAKVEVCRRTFTVYELPDDNVIVQLPKGSAEVRRNTEACERLGISTERTW